MNMFKVKMSKKGMGPINKQSSRNGNANKVKSNSRQTIQRTLNSGPKNGRGTNPSTSVKKPPKSAPGFSVYSSDSEVEDRKPGMSGAKFLKKFDKGDSSKTVFDPKDTCLNRDEDIVSQMQIVQEKRRIAGIVIPTAAMESPGDKSAPRSEELPQVSTPFNKRLVSSTPDPESLREAELLEQQQKIAAILLADVQNTQRPGVSLYSQTIDHQAFPSQSVAILLQTEAQTTNTTNTETRSLASYNQISNSLRGDVPLLPRTQLQRPLSPQMIPERDSRAPDPQTNRGLEQLTRILQEQRQFLEETEYHELPDTGTSVPSNELITAQNQHYQPVSEPQWQQLLKMYQLSPAPHDRDVTANNKGESFEPTCADDGGNQDLMISSVAKAEWVKDKDDSKIHSVAQTKTSTDGASTTSVVSHPHVLSSSSSSHSQSQLNSKKENVLVPHVHSSFEVVKTSSISSSSVGTTRSQKSSVNNASKSSSGNQIKSKEERKRKEKTVKPKTSKPLNSKAQKSKAGNVHKRGEDVPPSTVISNSDSTDHKTPFSVQSKNAAISIPAGSDNVNSSIDTCDEEVNQVISGSEVDRNKDGMNGFVFVDLNSAPESPVSESSNLSQVIELLKSDTLMLKKGAGSSEKSIGTNASFAESRTDSTRQTAGVEVASIDNDTRQTVSTSSDQENGKSQIQGEIVNSMNTSETFSKENFDDPINTTVSEHTVQSDNNYTNNNDDTKATPGHTKDSGLQETLSTSHPTMQTEVRECADDNVNQNHNYGEDRNFSRRPHNLDYLDKMADPKLRDIACRLAFKATALRDVELRDLIDDMIFHTDAALSHEDARFQSSQMFFTEENNKLKKRVQTINRQLESKERQERMGRNPLGLSNNDVLHLERKTMYLQQEKDRLDSQVTALLEEKARWLITQQDLVKTVSLKDHEILKLEEKHQSEKMRLHQSLDAATQNSQGVHFKLAVADREVTNLEQKLKAREGEIAALNDRVRETEEGRRRCEAGLLGRDAEVARLQDLVDTLKLGVDHVLQAYESSGQAAAQHQSRGMQALRVMAHPEDYRSQAQERGVSRTHPRPGELRQSERRHEGRGRVRQEQHESHRGREQHSHHRSKDRRRGMEDLDGQDCLTKQMLEQHNRDLTPFDRTLWRSLDDGPVAPPVDDLDPYYSDSEIQINAREKRRRSAAREKRRSADFAHPSRDIIEPRQDDDHRHTERRARHEVHRAERRNRSGENEYLNNGRVQFESDRREDPRMYSTHLGRSQVERDRDIRESGQRRETQSRDRSQKSGKDYSRDKRRLETERRLEEPPIPDWDLNQFDDTTRRDGSYRDQRDRGSFEEDGVEYPDLETVPIPSDEESEHSRYSVTDYFRNYPSAQENRDSRHSKYAREGEDTALSTLRSKTLTKSTDNNRSFLSTRPKSFSKINASYEDMTRSAEYGVAPESQSRHVENSQFFTLSTDPASLQTQAHSSRDNGGPPLGHHSRKHKSSSLHHMSHHPRESFIDNNREHTDSDLIVFERDESFEMNSRPSFRNQSSPLHISDISESRRATMGAGNLSQQDFFQGTELSASFSTISDSEPGPSHRNNNSEVSDRPFSTGIATLDAKIAKLQAKINRTKAIFS